MKKLYIFILELIVSACSIVLKRNEVPDETDSKEEVTEQKDETLSRSNRNTLAKLFTLRKKYKNNDKTF